MSLPPAYRRDQRGRWWNRLRAWWLNERLAWRAMCRRRYFVAEHELRAPMLLQSTVYALFRDAEVTEVPGGWGVSR